MYLRAASFSKSLVLILYLVQNSSRETLWLIPGEDTVDEGSAGAEGMENAPAGGWPKGYGGG